MFKTYVGPVEDDASVAYLRPETAQGIFVNFPNVQTTTRKKPPFGIAQIGKSFRNEITPGNFIFRTREFEQMEMEYFVPPEDGAQWYEYWCQERFRWYTDLGIPEEQLRLRPHDAEELSHYSAGTSDVEFMYPWGWGELEGIANRTDFDLTQHSEVLGPGPHVLRPGARPPLPAARDRARGRRRPRHARVPARGVRRGGRRPTARAAPRSARCCASHPRLAPIKVAVLPLSKNERLVPVADEVAALAAVRAHDRRRRGGSIGRRYRRQDEVGTPLCVTVDFDTLDDRAVTIRDRDTMAQERVPIDGLLAELQGRLHRMSDNYYEELGRRARRVPRRDPRRAPSARRRPRGRAREEGRQRVAAAANRERGRARARGVERAVRPVPAPALRRASSRGPASTDERRDRRRRRRRAGRGTAPELTGWRKLLAPPPPKQRTGGGNGANGEERRGARHRNGRPRPEPTIQLPAGMQLAEPRQRGMAHAVRHRRSSS